jgi:hypothetical protein
VGGPASIWEWIRWRVDALLPLLFVPGIAWLGRRLGRAALVPACVLLAHPLAMALLAPYRGPGFQEGRYSIHLLPLAIATAVAPLAAVSALRARRVAALALLAGVLVALPGAASRYGWAVQNIEAMQVHLAHWVTDHTPPAARLGLNDVARSAFSALRDRRRRKGFDHLLPYRREGRALSDSSRRAPTPDRLQVVDHLGDDRPFGRSPYAWTTTRWRRRGLVKSTRPSGAAGRRTGTCPAGGGPGPAGPGAAEKAGTYNRHVEPMKGLGRVLAAGMALGGLVCGAVAPASAQIYRWTDERGEVRFSQGINSVPPQARGGAVMMSTPGPSAPSAPAPAETPTSTAAPAGAARIPFTPGRPIMVSARINGGGTTQLILDTGAQGTVISPTALAALAASASSAARGASRGVRGGHTRSTARTAC